MNKNELAISAFNRENCKTGIVHLGVGNFHRAHQANYINEYLNTFNDLNWGICGINLRKEDSKKFVNALNQAWTKFMPKHNQLSSYNHQAKK